jgi:hypothetical protein
MFPLTPSLATLNSIPDEKFQRYAAHIITVYLLTCAHHILRPASPILKHKFISVFVLFLIRREYVHYTALRQAFLTSSSYSRLPQSRTVLLTSIPKSMCTERDLRLWGSFVPGGIQNIWVYKDSRVRLHFCQMNTLFVLPSPGVLFSLC